MTERPCVVQIADYNPAYPTNFLPALLHLERRLREQLGLGSVFVFPRTAEHRPWYEDLRTSGTAVDVVDRSASHSQRIRTLRRIGEGSMAVLLHTHFGTFDLDGSAAAKLLSCASVWHMHSPYPVYDTFRRRVGERIKFALARYLVDRIVAVSDTVADSAVMNGGPRSRISVVVNGVDTARFGPVGAERKRALRREYGLPEDPIVFLHFANFPKRKGFDVLLEAAQRLAGSSPHPPAYLVVGAEDNLDELREMGRGVPALRVIGPVPNVSDLYGLADGFVSASRAEGMPYALGEAMASCLPVISSDLPQVVRVYGPAGAGFVSFRGEDAGALAASMDSVARLSASERLRLGQANAAFVEAHLSLERWSAAIVEVYRSVLSSRGVSTGSGTAL